MKGNRFFLTFVAMLTSCSFMQAQSAPAAQPNPQNSQERTESAKPLDSKPLTGQASMPLDLKGIGPTDTERAAASVAKNLAKRREPQGKGHVEERDAKAAHEGPPPVAEGAVVEFRPAPSGRGADRGARPAASKDERQPGSRLHGEVYGAAGAGGHTAAESVGVTSKDRKTSGYLGSDQIRSELSQSH
jgi:hypothetical protein